MTIDEAIKILTVIKADVRGRFNPDDPLAVQLGIEALKFVKDYRVGLFFRKDYLMIGETED